MASVTSVELIDDIDGTPAAETVHFGLDGKAYELDLSEGNADLLRGAVGEYVKSARKIGRLDKTGTSTATGRPTVDREQLRAIRDWARKNGIDVANRGRISDLLRLAYDKQDPTLARS